MILVELTERSQVNINSYTVIIPTAGLGSRLGKISEFINKSLLSFDYKPVLSHIIERFPDDTKFIIPVGYNKDQVKDFCELTYSNKDIKFVDIEHYSESWTGPGYTVKQCLDHIDGPFFYIPCDTYFNEELKNVFPYIYKLVGEDNLPLRVVNPEDIVGVEAKDPTEQIQDEIEELSDFESYLNKLIGEEADIFSNDNDQQAEAIQKLNELVSQEFPVGPDGNNAKGSLEDIINDEELFDIFKELADISPETDARSILKDYIKIKDEENGTDILGKINFPEGEETPAEPPAEPAAEPAAPPSPEAAAPAPEAPAAPPSMPMSPGVAMAENIKRVIEKAKAAGMTAEDTFTLFGEEVSLADAIQRVGLDINEFFDQSGYKDSGDEVVEFVRSMFDEEGNTPKGPTGVLISVEKKFGEEALDKAKDVMNELMTQAEMRRIQELAGQVPEQSPNKNDYMDRTPLKANPKASGNYMDNKPAQGKSSAGIVPAGQSSQPSGQSKVINTKDDFEESILDSLRKMAGIR